MVPSSRHLRTAKIELLEYLRGFAAVYVFLCHRLSNGHPGLGPFSFGKEAVFIFFFLSGFVIYTSWQEHPTQTFGTYLSRRFLRIYPLFLLALLLSWLCVSPSHRLPGDDTPANFWGNAFMLQDDKVAKPGVWFETFCGNSPLWSLSYEWWFYMMFFPMVRFLDVPVQRFFVLGAAVGAFVVFAVFPNQISLFLMYFPVWWTGLELARLRRAPVLEQWRVRLFMLGTLSVLALVAGTRVVLAHQAKFPLALGDDPLLELRNFGFCSLCLALVTFLPLAIVKHLLGWLYPFGWIAPISYAVYILHMPLVVKAHYLAFLHNSALEAVGYVFVLLAVAYFGETIYQKAAKEIFRFIFQQRPAATLPPSVAEAALSSESN